MTKNVVKFVAGITGDALATAIFETSQFNLTSKEFAGRPMSGAEYHSKWDKTKERKWTITNRSALLRSGYKTGSKNDLKWEVGYEAPHAKPVDAGAPPHVVPFHKIYDWAWYRYREDDFPIDMPPNWSDPNYKKFYIEIIGQGKKDKKKFAVLNFAYWVWRDIKFNGVEPSFFFSDGVYSTVKHAKQIIANALVATGRVKVVS